ncbi:MAG: S41 family peptidase [Thermoguttaceae bacterium]
MARRFVSLAITLLLLLVPQGSPAADDPLRPEVPDDYELHRLLVETIDQVEQSYVRPIDRRKLVEAAIRGVLSQLDDYSGYIAPERMSRFQEAVSQQFDGIGVQIGVQRDQLIVISPLVGSPAYRAGIMAGDRILEINGRSTKGITVEDAVGLLKGETGSEVALKVSHAGSSEPVDVSLKREAIRLETVLGDRRGDDDRWDYFVDHERRIAYVQVTGFGRDTAAQLQKVLAELEKAKAAGLVLDLRFNPGGLLSSAIQVSDLFVSQGKIVSTAGRNVEEQVWEAQKAGTFEKIPVAVLINGYSASASEIVAACLQDHQRAVVVGERSFGKGSVQRVIEMEEGQSALKLTTAGYHRPNGKNIDRHPGDTVDQEWGVKPSDGYELVLSPSETQALIENFRKRDILRNKAQSAGPPSAEAAKTSEEPVPDARPEAATDRASEPEFVDRQLEKALDYLRGLAAAPAEKAPAEKTPAETSGSGEKPKESLPSAVPEPDSPAENAPGDGAKPDQP